MWKDTRLLAVCLNDAQRLAMCWVRSSSACPLQLACLVCTMKGMLGEEVCLQLATGLGGCRVEPPSAACRASSHPHLLSQRICWTW